MFQPTVSTYRNWFFPLFFCLKIMCLMLWNPSVGHAKPRNHGDSAMTRRQGMNVTGMTIHGCCTNKIQGTSNQWEFQGTSNKWFIIGWLGVYVLESIFSVQASFGRCKYFQWEFQDPRLEVPTIYKAYFSGLCKGISPQFIWPYMVLTYLHFRILKFPLIQGKKKCQKETLKKLEGAFGWFSDKKNAPPHGFL